MSLFTLIFGKPAPVEPSVKQGFIDYVIREIPGLLDHTQIKASHIIYVAYREYVKAYGKAPFETTYKATSMGPRSEEIVKTLRYAKYATPNPVHIDTLTPEMIEILDMVIKFTKTITGGQMVRVTHDNIWRERYIVLPDNRIFNGEIRPKHILEYAE